MSVPVSHRSENKLEVAMCSRELCTYTLHITSNDKIFIPQHYNTLTSKLQSLVINIHDKVWRAINLKITSFEKFNERRRLQTEAINDCNSLLSLINIAHRLFHLSGKRIEYWSGLTIKTLKLIINFKDSDSRRYSHLTQK